MMATLESSSKLNCVEDSNHETTMKYDGENNVCSVRDQSTNITLEQITLAKNDPPVFDKSLFGTALDPTLFTSPEDYSDVSSCSETDFGDILNVLGKTPEQSSEFLDADVSRDKTELKIDFCQAGSNNGQVASDESIEMEHYVCGTSPVTEAERRCGTVDMIDGNRQVQSPILNLENERSNFGTAENDNECPLNTEKQGFLIQATDCAVPESSKICEDTTEITSSALSCAVPEDSENCKDTTEISSSCSLDLMHVKPSIETDGKNTIITKSVSVLNNFLIKEINPTSTSIKEKAPEYELNHNDKTAHDTKPEEDKTMNSQENEHGSFEFLQSCFGLNSLDNAKVNLSVAGVSLSADMTQYSQNCEANHTQPPVLVTATPESVPTGQIQVATYGGLLKPLIKSTATVSQDLQQQNDFVEDKFTKDLAETECKDDAYNKNRASLLSSSKLMRKLQPVVLLKTTKQNAEDANMYICSLCQNNMQTLDELIEHLHCEHSKHTFQYCLSCGAYFSGEKLKKHFCEQKFQLSDAAFSTAEQMTKTQHAKYRCKYCQKPFMMRYYHQDHEQRHTTVTPYRCDCCGLYFSHAKKLSDHKRKVRCYRLILETNEQRKKRSETALKCTANPSFMYRGNGSQVGINDCFVKLVDINKAPSQQTNCSFCGKRFKLRAQLKIHLSSHTSVKPFKCSKCKKVFKYSWNLDKHKREICYGSFTKQITQPSTSDQLSGRFACPTCPRTFIYSYNRTRHMKTQCLEEYIQMRKGKLGNGYKCPLCPETFSMSFNLERHIKNTCFKQYKLQRKSNLDTNSKNESPQNQESSSPNSSDVKTISDVICRFCDKSFTSSNFLKNHLRLHVGKRPFHCSECGKNFAKRGHLVTHKNVHKRRIQCLVCRKIMPTLGDLIKHRQSHIKKGMLQCPDCSMQFKFPVFFLRHVASHVKKEAKSKSSLSTKPTVKPTVKESGGSELFKCGICRKTFVDSKEMSAHCVTHLPKTSICKCPVCKKNFTCRTGLIRHFRLHTGEKPFSCKNCGMRFRRREQLGPHEVKCKGSHEHKPFSPTPAISQTQQKCQVRTASKMDRKNKKFACSYCPHIFSMSGSLLLHERAHLANNLFPCVRCGKYFKRNKVYGHQKQCKLKKSTSVETFSSEKKSGQSQKSEWNGNNLDVANKTCTVSKGSKTTVRDRFNTQCPHCSKCFQYRSYLIRHLRSHSGKQFACKHCNKKYGHARSCERHEASCNVLQQNESKKTKIIPDVQSADGLKKCVILHGEDGEQLKCNFCTKTFTKPRNLRRHILSHTEVKPYSCKTCENCFSRYDHMMYHQKRCRGKKQQLVEEEHCVGSQANTQPENDVLECNICSKKFSSHSNLTRHMNMLHFTVKPFFCKICGTGFTSKDSLNRHNVSANCKVSSIEQPEPASASKLDVSVKPYRETSKLLQRIEGNYSQKWRFACKYCPRHFKIQSQLIVHTRLHTGEKPFRCAFCDERFIRSDYLERHLNKCGGRRQGPKVLCDKCGGMFTQEALDKHHNDCISSSKSADLLEKKTSTSTPSDVKVFSCYTCNQGFLLFSQLQQHILTLHKSDGLQQSGEHELSCKLPIKEEPLEENYAENSSPQNNITKDCERPFACKQCEMRFITSCGLGSHMRIHTTIYPFFCQKCNKGFCSKVSQEKHMKKCKSLEVKQTECSTTNVISSELEVTGNEVIVFNKDPNTTGTGVVQTKFSCKDQGKGNAVVNKYQCSECEKSFTDGLMLISHLEAHGREEQERRLVKSHCCHICGKAFDQGVALQTHMKTHNQETPTNTCPECFKSFRSPSDLDIHRSYHDPNRPFVCNTCNLRFWTPKSLSSHQRVSHSASEALKTIEQTMKTDSLSPKLFTCRPCNKVYSIKKSYLEHCRLKHRSCSSSVDLKSATTKCELSNNQSDGNNAGDVSDDDSDSAPYFPCHVCGKTFLTSESLEDHQRCHLGEKPHECEECGKCFVQLVNLQQHQRSHKSEFQCQMCGKGFVSLFALRKHKNTHLKKHPHRCTKCHLSFTKSSKLAEHMISHRDENFPCDLCHEIFSCKSSRAEHRKIHAEEELPPLIPPAKKANSSPSTSPSLSTVQKNKYRCEICQVRFPTTEQLSEHGCSPAKERPYSCKDCNKHFLHGSHLKKHQLTHQLSGTQSFQCNSCNMSFIHRHHFLTHLQTHGGEETSKSQTNEVKVLNTDDSNQDKLYRCPICPESFCQVLELANHLSVHANVCNVCNKTFSTKQQLEKHEQSHLSAATQYECTECGKSFLGSDAFRQHSCVHQKRPSNSPLPPSNKKRCLENYSGALTNNEEEEVDVGEDFYNCPTCNKRFPSKITLREHEKLHEIDRPFKCLICGKSFAKKKYLNRHQRIHNNASHKCDLCAKSFKTVQSLLSHCKTHDEDREYRCEVCDTSYKTRHDLSRHTKRRHGLQSLARVTGNHRCDMCYKSFGILSQLKSHQETHVGQVVYECTECDKAFAFLHLLEEHQQTHKTSTNSSQSQSSSDVLFHSRVIE